MHADVGAEAYLMQFPSVAALLRFSLFLFLLVPPLAVVQYATYRRVSARVYFY